MSSSVGEGDAAGSAEKLSPAARETRLQERGRDARHDGLAATERVDPLGIHVGPDGREAGNRRLAREREPDVPLPRRPRARPPGDDPLGEALRVERSLGRHRAEGRCGQPRGERRRVGAPSEDGYPSSAADSRGVRA